MTGTNMPEADIAIDIDLVRQLVAEQHSDLAGLEIVELANGWDNAMFRLGADLTVRLPRRELSAVLIENEQRWLPMLKKSLPLPISAPVRLGEPSDDFPWAWSVLPWFDGEVVEASISSSGATLDGATMATDLGRFLAALHLPADPDAPENAVRGVPLAVREEATRERIVQLDDQSLNGNRWHSDSPQIDVVRRWEQYVSVEPWAGPPLWVHGDLHPLNMLHREGALRAIIDFGDLTSGDPANDLGVAWMLFDEDNRHRFRAAAESEIRPIDKTMWARAAGWALSIAITMLAHSADNPTLFGIGHRTLQTVMAEPG